MEDSFIQGGWSKQNNVNSKKVKGLVSVASMAMKAKSGLLASGEWTCTKVLSVYSQIVQGMNYKITGVFTSATG